MHSSGAAGGAAGGRGFEGYDPMHEEWGDDGEKKRQTGGSSWFFGFRACSPEPPFARPLGQFLSFHFLGLVLRMMSAIHSSVVRSVSTCTAVLGMTIEIPRTTGCQTFAKCLYRRCDGDRIHLSCCTTISMNAPTPWDAVVAGGALEVAALGSGCKRVGTAHAQAWMRASDCICADNNQV